jgi:hypothetical protein
MRKKEGKKEERGLEEGYQLSDIPYSPSTRHQQQRICKGWAASSLPQHQQCNKLTKIHFQELFFFIEKLLRLVFAIFSKL